VRASEESHGNAAGMEANVDRFQGRLKYTVVKVQNRGGECYIQV